MLENQLNQNQSFTSFINNDTLFNDPSIGELAKDEYKFYIHCISNYPLLSAEQEKSALIKCKNGDMEAKELLINSNLRLVISIAKRFANNGVGLMDLIQEGNMGLINAIEKFDISKETRLSTYATWWIEQAIKRCVDNESRNVRIPVHFYEEIRKVKRARNSLFTEGIKNPTSQEIADELGEGYTAKKVEEILYIGQEEDSLDRLVKDESDSCSLGDMIGDANEESPVEYADKQHLVSKLNEALSKLMEREKIVIEMRFGLNGNGENTLEAIGQHFGFTRERARQLLTRGMNKLKKILGNDITKLFE